MRPCGGCGTCRLSAWGRRVADGWLLSSRRPGRVAGEGSVVLHPFTGGTATWAGEEQGAASCKYGLTWVGILGGGGGGRGIVTLCLPPFLAV
jgi:hypothetical protein